jgi:hypothetical protein
LRGREEFVVADLILDSNCLKKGRVAAPKVFMLVRERMQKEYRSVSHCIS